MIPVIVAALFAVGTVSASQADKNAYKQWTGMRLPNTSYDWLRPPSSVLQEAILQVYRGRVRAEELMYRYRKTIDIGPFRSIWGIWLGTPRTAAGNLAQTARNHFDDQPSPASVSRWEATLIVTIGVESLKERDIPEVALVHGTRIVRPVEQLDEGSDREPCTGSRRQQCWLNSAILRFDFSDDERLAGVGTLLFRWAGTEARVPVNFDYLW